MVKQKEKNLESNRPLILAVMFLINFLYLFYLYITLIYLFMLIYSYLIFFL